MLSDEERLFARTDGQMDEVRVLDASNAQNRELNRNPTPDDATNYSSSYSSQSSTTTTTTPPPMQPPVRKPRWLLLELPVFLIFFALNITGAVYQNQILYQTCRAVYNYSDSDCQPLLSVERESPETQQIETEIQAYVSQIFMARSLLESILPAIVSLFIGPWSDKFGRRPILVSSFLGYPLGLVIFSILAFISRQVVISPWWFLVASLPAIFCGGTCALITGIYCYISDCVHGRSMALRMIFNEASLCAGMMFGSICSSYIYEATNLPTTFAIAASIAFTAWCYVFFVIDESLKPEQIHTGPRLREFFRFSLVRDLVYTCCKRRPNFDRAIIWLTMGALTLVIFTMEGESNVSYLFVRERFAWTLKDFTFYNAARIIVQIVGSIFGTMILRKVLNFSIISLTMIAFGSCVLESTVRATAMYAWELYIGMFLGMMRGIVGPMSRAILSHVAPANEVGKIMALTTSLESLSPLPAAPLYTSVYDATLAYYPGAYNFISTGVDLVCYTFIAGIYGIQKSLGNTVTYEAIGS